MFAQTLTELQNQFFSGLNQLAEPLIRAGLGNPPLWTTPWATGAIAVETRGRKTGRKIRIPVLAARIGEFVIFSTVRRNSQWVKNLAANTEVRYWLAGVPREATAFVFTPDEKFPAENLPSNAACLAQFLQMHSRCSGISFALLTPR